MSSERVQDISSRHWDVRGAQFTNAAGRPSISFGRAGTNASGQRAETDFTAVSDERYTVSFRLFSQDVHIANHSVRVEVFDEDTGRVIARYNTSIGDGQDRGHSFSFNGSHSGNLTLRFTGTGSSGHTHSSDLVVHSVSVRGKDPATVPPPPPPPCFTAGTLIATPQGLVPVEALAGGMCVTTLDSGAQPILWIGTFAGPATGKLAPIRIPAGVLGNRRALVVSPQHRLLVASRIAERMFGASEMLVPAVKLLGHQGIARLEGGSVTYMHLLFDRHEIVFADGAATESLLLRPQALRSLGLYGAADEIVDKFPDVLKGHGPHTEPARPIIDSGRLAGRLLQRHLKNGRPLAAPEMAVA